MREDLMTTAETMTTAFLSDFFQNLPFLPLSQVFRLGNNITEPKKMGNTDFLGRDTREVIPVLILPPS